MVLEWDLSPLKTQAPHINSIAGATSASTLALVKNEGVGGGDLTLSPRGNLIWCSVVFDNQNLFFFASPLTMLTTQRAAATLNRLTHVRCWSSNVQQPVNTPHVLQAIRGTHDLFPEEMRKYRHIINKLESVVKLYGFEEISLSLSLSHRIAIISTQKALD